ncbi:AraC family transcriptional regulator [Terrimonas sp. NA20]|uniref:AraC family transcriptional regulator n=1 Tax=Terrimonas ginsenosidimutans TaxID=2908004 RepID=A0ABS9KXT6_9BACT|nr:AraC family transcriptional regulator [Terrimonas ginsenosidimutans]MCG2617057.1 AraC family transcriptional regulator [Terrimonas ginsenosidimutans]
MKPFFENIPSKQGDQSFLAYRMDVPAFEFKWHYHPEFELTLILNGSGKRLIGDSHENFGPGDLILIGPSVPHTWVSDTEEKNCSAVVIQFSEQLTSPFLKLPEMSAIAKMLATSSRGLFFPDSLPELAQLPELPGPERLLRLFSTVEQLSRQNQKTLVSQNFSLSAGNDMENRVNKVGRYILRNLDRKLTLEEAAALVHLSLPAFSRFFKRATGKTFSDYVNEVRVGRACALLTGTDLPVGEIAYRCGFENMAYFNRIFLRKKSINPKAFRDNFFLINSANIN